MAVAQCVEEEGKFSLIFSTVEVFFFLSSGGSGNYGGPSGNDSGYGNRSAPYSTRGGRGGRGGGGRGRGRGQ